MWAGAAGLAVGLGLLVSASPPDYISQFAHRKFSGNLGLLYLFVGEGGELIAFVTTVALLAVVKDRLVGGRTPVPPERALRNVAWCFFAALAMAGVGLAARRWGEPAMFAPTVVLAMGGLIVLETLVTDRWVRLGLLAWMIAVQVVVVAQALLYLVPAHAAFEQRIATLEAAPRGGTATIDPYPEVLPAFWFVGEDLGPATVRQEVAVRLFGLQDIQFSEPFARLEPPPHLPLRMAFVTEPAATPAELAAVVPPVIAADITVARRQFRSALRRLRRTHRVVDARLEAPELDFQGRNGRPVLLARLDGDDVIAPRAFAAGADRTNAYAFAPDERTWPEGYTVQVIGPGGVPIAVQEARRGLIFRPLVVDTFTLLLCNATECFAVQSMWTRM